jgi:hypothetical protein
MPAPEDLAVIQRELPAWIEEMDRRGVRLFGRELDLPDLLVQPMEVRAFVDGPWLGGQAAAFGRGEDGAARPYLLATWTRGPATDDQAATDELEAWRQDLEARDLHVLGGILGAADTARTVRVRERETQVSHGPFNASVGFIAGIDVVSCADRPQAVALAASHPRARCDVIEVRPFYVAT